MTKNERNALDIAAKDLGLPKGSGLAQILGHRKATDFGPHPLPLSKIRRLLHLPPAKVFQIETPRVVITSRHGGVFGRQLKIQYKNVNPRQ